MSRPDEKIGAPSSGEDSASKEYTGRGWRDGSVVKSTDCPSRGPGFNSQHPHGSSQLSEDPVAGDHTNAHKIKNQINFKRKRKEKRWLGSVAQ